MAIKPEIKAKIVDAALALVAQGVEAPTNDQVREYLGGGSLSHISPVMREWREARKAEVSYALDMPDELKKAMLAGLGQMWATASKLASVTVETVTKEAEEAKAALAQERDEALSEVARLEDTVEAANILAREKDQKISEQENTIKDMQVASNAAQLEATSLKGQNQALEFRVADRDKEIADLKAELKEMRAELIAIAKGGKAGK